MSTAISSKVGELELECSSTISSEVVYGTSEARPVSPEVFVRRLEVVRNNSTTHLKAKYLLFRADLREFTLSSKLVFDEKTLSSRDITRFINNVHLVHNRLLFRWYQDHTISAGCRL